MHKLLIENVAVALGKNPTLLDDIELRKLCILIDWTLALLTQAPHTPLLQRDIALMEDFTGTLARIIQADGFVELNEQNPNSEKMDDMFRRLGHQLGFSDDMMDDIDTGFISDYETALTKDGLFYTNSLKYKSKLTEPEKQALNNITQQLFQQFLFLRKSEHSLFEFNANECAISINHFFDFMPSNLTTLEKANFCLTLLNHLVSFQKNFKRSISESSLHSLCTLLENLQPALPASKDIEQGLTELITQTKRSPIVDGLRQILTRYLMRFPNLRGWENFDNFQSQPIDRVILLGYQDIADEEIIRVVNLMYRKHPNENIVVTFNPEDVLRMNNPFTLQVIGHGTIEGPNTINSNLGPFRGDARVTGKQVAELVNKCPHVEHLRLYSCFSGKLNYNNRQRLTEKQRPHHANAHIRRKLNMMLDGNLTPENSPFVEYAPAVSCWNAINKAGRNIRMTVSPGIFEPEEALGCMVWKESSCDEDLAKGIKDICVTTTSAASYLPQRDSKMKPATMQLICSELENIKITTIQPHLF
ncbi:MAG: hypothetical protein AB7I18_02855 [Candidatus Berkiella sp.]